ncbi:Acetyltransferase [Marinobacterium lacunae]|uniref:Acetyltransferase n=1 Tax=Marinobacterium lacunae TaxID=1232683 RepID=A0A081G4C2_9GAMM|nr:GNAT family N-acetyltransferase [Marinobacterium lacunae]KEA65627.1 Acetyltransferase [Marinobacterium lacunae]
MSVRVRSYRPVDAWRVTDIFYNSVHSIDERFYSLQEINAWAPLPVEYAQWVQRLNAHDVLVAEVEGVIAGFTAMEPDGYIDWLYVHSDYQHRGVASALYAEVEKQARDAGLPCLHVHASHVAKPFFLHKGFSVLSQNRVERLGIALINWEMEKRLS